MELSDAVRRRRMVRDYAPDPVDPAVLDRVLDHATRAPSAGATQGWAFLVLDTRADVDRFWEVATPPDRAAAPDPWLRGMRRAPVVVVPFADRAAYEERYARPDKHRSAPDGRLPWDVPYWHVDTGMAVLLMLLTAVDEGLGACLFGVPRDRVDAVRSAFGVPAALEPVGAVTIGHPAGAPGRPGRARRRPVQDVVHRGRWGPPGG